MQQPVASSHQPVTVPRNNGERSERNTLRRRSFARLSIVQIIVGSLSLVFGITSIVVGCVGSYSGIGIWCGIFFIVTGSLGCITSMKFTNCWIITSMVMCIVAATLSGPIFVISAAVTVAHENTYILEECSYNKYGHYDCTYGHDYTCTGIDAVLLVIAIIEFISAIIQASLCCQPLCCSQRNQPMMYYVAGQPYGVPQQATVYMMPPGAQVITQQGGQQFQSMAPVVVNPIGSPQQFAYAQQQPGMVPVAGQPLQQQYTSGFQEVASGTRRHTPPPGYSTLEPEPETKTPLA
ncbi:uncharacterized protein LOC102802982 [Saccoglossus kowalevskii]|uniref:Membrane-spanning 4-domains subfamily A member 8-like isoform X1 n=1 Tax=Saccoglossus kowalevskii TaxID=10224 RepID=A0ABM0MLG1_SACKO|nr:PREDICTED: membrane-spanning 4-domains subfamily A member 8-like isoform X1 [Saccoglossus kowalevskii]XP_006820853.1 PREDICTED: membrane-spanning 4-domains subfamily A member 8-like isoform X2 [Saccoglossus kowalevskii]